MRDELAWLTGTGREPLAITARRCASKDGAAGNGTRRVTIGRSNTAGAGATVRAGRPSS